MSNKALWHGTFNWQRQNIEYYTHAHDEHIAFCNICEKIAEEAQTTFRRVYNYFFDKKNTKYILVKMEDKNDNRA